MSEPSPRCSIVIRAYNEERDLPRLLDALSRQTLRDHEIILVDSGSTDGTLAVASRYPVRVLHIQPDDFTFGRSLNMGIEAARGEYIAIASAHVYPVADDWLESLLAPFSDPQIALTYGKQRGDSSTRFSEEQHFHQYFPEHSQPRQSDAFCNNANAAIRRVLWGRNPYDESLAGLEDIAWASWAVHQGYFLAYVAGAEVVHVHRESPRQVFNRHRREAMAMRGILPNSRFKLRHFLRLYLTSLLKDALAALRQRTLLKNAFSILWFRFMQYWGTYWGYNRSPQLTSELRQVFYYSPSILTSNRQVSSQSVSPIPNHEPHP